MHREQAQRQYYEAAFRTLLFVEARRPTRRRFGADADATWRAFCGDLGASARIDLLLRDADAEWPGAFGARSVYGVEAVAEDEPFGAQWQSLDDVNAEALRSCCCLRSVAASWPLDCGRSALSMPRRLPSLRALSEPLVIR